MLFSILFVVEGTGCGKGLTCKEEAVSPLEILKG
jgi:hypothetical protein